MNRGLNVRRLSGSHQSEEGMPITRTPAGLGLEDSAESASPMNVGLLIHHHATVYIKRLSGDVVGRRRREESHRLGDIFRLAHAGDGQRLNTIIEAASHLCL